MGFPKILIEYLMDCVESCYKDRDGQARNAIGDEVLGIPKATFIRRRRPPDHLEAMEGSFNLPLPTITLL
jgi:hypothetical protein